MIKRTNKLYDVGTLPELGVVPEKMHAWTIRTERLGEPKDAFREEIIKVPDIKENEVLIANLCASISYNGIWAALG